MLRFVPTGLGFAQSRLGDSGVWILSSSERGAIVSRSRVVKHLNGTLAVIGLELESN